MLTKLVILFRFYRMRFFPLLLMWIISGELTVREKPHHRG